MRVEKRINEIVNRLNRTKVERKTDLKGSFINPLSLNFPSKLTAYLYVHPAG